ncbi:CLUMA_CG017737, isoform A [Clunio marinus]|uniref:CLUMA_CG017737, isoform A n=1 Tax=Clunio marinus TaxID=568069 RepID=A0A1J1J1E2_9DIPT|nr:CLUMA_CG017737, isoform A [Clunio marinus]
MVLADVHCIGVARDVMNKDLLWLLSLTILHLVVDKQLARMHQNASMKKNFFRKMSQNHNSKKMHRKNILEEEKCLKHKIKQNFDKLLCKTSLTRFSFSHFIVDVYTVQSWRYLLRDVHPELFMSNVAGSKFSRKRKHLTINHVTQLPNQLLNASSHHKHLHFLTN